MGRVNKFTSGVFTDIVGNEKEMPLYDQFMRVQTTLDSRPSKKLDGFLKMYTAKIKEHKSMFDELAMIETVIMQLRSRDNISTDDIKLNIVREYIYARIPFHRNDKEGKDIRVIVGLTEVHGTDLKNLSGNEEVMKIAKEKLTLAMDSHIQINIEKLKNWTK